MEILPMEVHISPLLITNSPWTLFMQLSFTRSHISWKHFRRGRMAPSEWTCSDRAVSDTPVADYSVAAVNTTHQVAYCPPIAVLPFLLALSVSHVKQTLWRCGQLWPYVGMGSLGTHLHRDYNGWCCENLASHYLYIKLEECRKVRRCDTTRLWGSTPLRGSTQSRTERVRPKVECEFSLYDKRRWRWDDVYPLRGLPNIYSLSLCPPLLPRYLRTTAVTPGKCTWSSVFEMHLEM